MAQVSNTTTRPRRRTARGRATSYREPDSDSEFEVPSGRRTLPTRSSRRIETYHEDSDSSDRLSSPSLPSDNDAARSASRSPTSRTRTNQPRRRISTRKQEEHKRKQASTFQGYKRRKIDSNVSDGQELKRSHSFVRIIVPPSGTIPKWQNLEYQILLKIMQYAAYPLYTGPSRDSGSMRWLLETSELCSSFHDACIGALMYSPPLLPGPRAHWLMNLLRASMRQFDPSNDERSSRRTLSLDYRRKIKRLDIEVKHLFISKRGVDMEELLTLTPLLSELRLYHNHDEMESAFIWAQPRYSKDKWSCGNLFNILDRLEIRLKTFEWNGRFLKNDPILDTLHEAHSKSCLIGLRRLEILNINVDNVEKDTDRLDACRSALTSALSGLSDLVELGFQSCNVLDSTTVTKLPKSLSRLSFRRCPYVTSDGLLTYLTDAGVSLLDLELCGNQVLDMGFMPELKHLCPRLAHLTMDLNFSDPTSYRDTEPLFDELLPHGAPTWPESLSSIILGPLRSLSAEDAEAFYNSLIQAEQDLPYLRKLIIKTLLKDISWRDRAKMRSKWLTLFENTFLATNSFSVSSINQHARSSTMQSKRDTDEDSNNRKSARLRDLGDAGSQDMQKPKLDGIASHSVKNARQPLCSIVIFELSDQRPAQDQYTERDFLDDEPSDDGDWNGRDTERMVPIYSARHYGW